MNGLRWLVLRRLGREALFYAPWPAAIWLAQVATEGLNVLQLLIPMLMASLLLKPSSPVRVLERYAPPAETEWRLVKGIWSRRALARAFLAETVGSSLLRAALFTALATLGASGMESNRISSPFSLGEPPLFGTAFLFALGWQTVWFVIANAPASQRTPHAWRGADLLRTHFGEWATNLRLLVALGVAVAVFGISPWATGSPWGVIVPAFGSFALLAWLLPAVESPSGGSGAAPRRDARFTSISPRSFRPILGLLWEGSYRSTKLLLGSSVLLTLIVVQQVMLKGPIETAEIRGISWLANSVLLVVMMRRPFRWQSAGDGARFLWTAGVGLASLRRVELLFGLGAGLLAIVPAFAFAGPSMLATVITSMVLPICPMVLLCNRAPLKLPGLKRVRVRDHATTFLWCLAVMFFAGGTLLSLLPASWTIFFSGALLSGVFGVFVLGGFAAWIWAFVRAGDDEALRRFEFDRLSGVR